MDNYYGVNNTNSYNNISIHTSNNTKDDIINEIINENKDKDKDKDKPVLNFTLVLFIIGLTIYFISAVYALIKLNKSNTNNINNSENNFENNSNKYKNKIKIQLIKQFINKNIIELFENKEECPICFEYFSEVFNSQCNHIMCKNCTLKVLESGGNCPLCRQILIE